MSGQRTLRLGISPCPNDTFIFAALLDGRVKIPGYRIEPELLDVDALNSRALSGSFDVCKMSTALVADVADKWLLLRSGGALGKGVGPLLVARPGTRLSELDGNHLAVPGLGTTGHLLLRLFARDKGFSFKPAAMVFSQVMEAVAMHRYRAGVVIHEGRFTYGGRGLEVLADLGQWWEETFSLPVPLGIIAIRRELGLEAAGLVNQAIVQSLETARDNPKSVMPMVEKYAQEMDPGVVLKHIDTFVTDFSLDVGPNGEQACLALLAEAARMAGTTLPESGLFLPRDAA